MINEVAVIENPLKNHQNYTQKWRRKRHELNTTHIHQPKNIITINWKNSPIYIRVIKSFSFRLDVVERQNTTRCVSVYAVNGVYHKQTSNAVRMREYIFFGYNLKSTSFSCLLFTLSLFPVIFRRLFSVWILCHIESVIGTLHVQMNSKLTFCSLSQSASYAIEQGELLIALQLIEITCSNSQSQRQKQ